jgi:hypothetical protein
MTGEGWEQDVLLEAEVLVPSCSQKLRTASRAAAAVVSVGRLSCRPTTRPWWWSGEGVAAFQGWGWSSGGPQTSWYFAQCDVKKLGRACGVRVSEPCIGTKGHFVRRGDRLGG